MRGKPHKAFSAERMAFGPFRIGHPLPNLGGRDSKAHQPLPPSSSWGVNSFGLWLTPPTLGTKIIAVGARRAIICASWPAPDVMRLAFQALSLMHIIRSSSRLLRSKFTGLKASETFGRNIDALVPLKLGPGTLIKLVLHDLQASFIGIAQIDGQGGTRGYHVDRVRFETDRADGCNCWCIGAADVVPEASDDTRCSKAGVMPQIHRRRASMVRFTFYRDALPRDALDRLDRAELILSCPAPDLARYVTRHSSGAAANRSPCRRHNRCAAIRRREPRRLIPLVDSASSSANPPA